MLAFMLQFAVTGGVLLFVQQASKRVLDAEQHELVRELQDELMAAWHAGGEPELRQIIEARLETTHGGAEVILYARPDGKPIAGNLGAWPTVIAPRADWRSIDLYRTDGERPERMGVVAMRLPDGSRLLTGHVIEANLRLVRVNREAILLALLAGLAMSLLGALIMGRLISRKIQTVAATANMVGDGTLSERVVTDGSGDAFDALGRSINAMLDRIEALVSQLRLLTDGLAHDLRSPVTRMKSLIERAIVDTRDTATLSTLERVSAEVETLLGMLSTALQISRAESGIGRDRFAEIDVAALLDDLVEIYGPLAEDMGFTLQTDVRGPIRTRLHREFVSQAIGNLIENALKYAENGNRIVLGASVSAGQVVLTVADNGPGIPADRHEEALKRFGRLDPARHIAGSGLGLALVEAVARLHNGGIALSDNAPGLCVALSLQHDI
ncbi:putative two-component histidine kinase [Caenibius tardaugens NBRC 16725]|uniref:histidine kinase n=1 Tax=Caenibius tardaugens NBRC 16725 TaxID=1219035 RepID=U3A6Y8_9SPHN|nr:putative two-component histidine kinase [Caenibius tardaugens NBRC 16725]